MAIDIKRCLTEVRCPTTSGYGTGYLIAPDLVLTACHVIADPLDQPPHQGVDIEIRTIGHFIQGTGFIKAKLIWPPELRWAELFKFDVALLEIKPDTITKAAAQRLRLGPDGIPQSKELDVHFTGFPRLMKIPDTNNRDTKQARGEVDLLSTVKQDLLAITLKGKPLEDDTDWMGASGAAVFADEQIIGVLKVKLRGKNTFDFYATRLDPALNDEAFRTRIVTSSANIAEPPAELELNLSHLACLLDRDPQETSFRTKFRDSLSARPSRPLCCLIYGAARHLPGELMNRFASVTIPELRKQRVGETLRFWPISWPSGDVDATMGLLTLRGLLWNALSDADGSEPPADPAEYSKRLSDESRPHLFATELSAAQLTSEGAALWGAWLTFLDSIAACELARSPLHIFLVSNVNRAQIDAWLKPIPPTQTTIRHPLDELSFCMRLDFQEWIGQRVPKLAPAHAKTVAKLKDDLEQVLDDMVGFGAEFSIHDLKQAIRKLTKGSI